MPLTVRPFLPRDREAAAKLLAASHRVARGLQPALPARFETVEACAKAIQAALLDTGADAMIAERDGQVVGNLGGTKSYTAPNSFSAQYSPTLRAPVSLAGHAVAADEDATEVYRELYTPLAELWADDGIFSHGVSIRATDAAERKAWFMLGFGATSTLATLETASPPTRTPAEAAIEIHAATAEEIDIVRHLDELESLHHRASPIFWPHLGGHVAGAVEAFQRAALDGTDSPIFIATRDGKPVAMHFVMRVGGFGGPLSTPDGAAYLYQAIVEPEARGGGIGTALLRHTLDWAHDEGIKDLTLHYAVMNASGAPFWLHHGFQPVELNLDRHLDERIAWARQR